jgi:LysM repeat protein
VEEVVLMEPTVQELARRHQQRMAEIKRLAKLARRRRSQREDA